MLRPPDATDTIGAVATIPDFDVKETDFNGYLFEFHLSKLFKLDFKAISNENLWSIIAAVILAAGPVEKGVILQNIKKDAEFIKATGSKPRDPTNVEQSRIASYIAKANMDLASVPRAPSAHEVAMLRATQEHISLLREHQEMTYRIAKESAEVARAALDIQKTSREVEQNPLKDLFDRRTKTIARLREKWNADRRGMFALYVKQLERVLKMPHMVAYIPEVNVLLLALEAATSPISDEALILLERLDNLATFADMPDKAKQLNDHQIIFAHNIRSLQLYDDSLQDSMCEKYRLAVEWPNAKNPKYAVSGKFFPALVYSSHLEASSSNSPSSAPSISPAPLSPSSFKTCRETDDDDAVDDFELLDLELDGFGDVCCECSRPMVIHELATVCGKCSTPLHKKCATAIANSRDHLCSKCLADAVIRSSGESAPTTIPLKLTDVKIKDGPNVPVQALQQLCSGGAVSSRVVEAMAFLIGEDHNNNIHIVPPAAFASISASAPSPQAQLIRSQEFSAGVALSGHHWICYFVHKYHDGRISLVVYNPQTGTDPDSLTDRISQFLKAHDASVSVKVSHVTLPQQQSPADCGVFALAALFCFVRRVRFVFLSSPKESQSTRLWLVHCIRAQKIFEPNWLNPLVAFTAKSTRPIVNVQNFCSPAETGTSLAGNELSATLLTWNPTVPQITGFSQAHLKRQTQIIKAVRNIILRIEAFQKIPIGRACTSAIRMIARHKKWAPSTELTMAAALESGLRRAQLFGSPIPIHLKNSPWWECFMRDLSHKKRTQGRGPTVGITKEQLTAALDLLPPQLQLITELCWSHAGRMGNLLACHPAWITTNVTNSTVRILWKDSKTAATRGVYSNSATMRTESVRKLEEWLRTLPQNRPIADQNQALKTMTIIRAALRSQVPLADLRSIRRGSLRAMAKAGVDMATMMRISGHQSEQSLLIYIESGVEAEAIHHQTAAATANLVL
jgi:hypothetical protein